MRRIDGVLWELLTGLLPQRCSYSTSSVGYRGRRDVSSDVSALVP